MWTDVLIAAVDPMTILWSALALLGLAAGFGSSRAGVAVVARRSGRRRRRTGHGRAGGGEDVGCQFGHIAGQKPVLHACHPHVIVRANAARTQGFGFHGSVTLMVAVKVIYVHVHLSLQVKGLCTANLVFLFPQRNMPFSFNHSLTLSRCFVRCRAVRRAVRPDRLRPPPIAVRTGLRPVATGLRPVNATPHPGCQRGYVRPQGCG